MLVNVSVITCRRPLGLERLLNTLKQQRIKDDIRVHIQIVDNAGDQKTKALVQGLRVPANFTIAYAFEPVPGIVAARNKCVELFLRSNADYLLFIDDDEIPQSNHWIQRFFEAADKHQADVVTSHVLGEGEPDTPDWALNIIHGRGGNIDGKQVSVFYTNNVCIGRRVFLNISPAFDERFALTGASDYHFSLKCKLMGFKVVYSDNPVIETFPASRASLGWFARRGLRSGIGYTKTHVYEEQISRAIILCSAMSIIRAVRGVLCLVLGAFYFDKGKLVEAVFRLSSSVGTLAGFFGVSYQEYKTIHGS